MKILAHYNKQQLEQFIQELIHLHEQYTQKVYDLDMKLSLYFKQCSNYYKQIGAATNELKFKELSSYLETAKNGINPRTYEKLKVGRRENIQIASFHCLTMAGEYLKTSLQETLDMILEAQVTIDNVFLNLIQSGILSSNMIQDCDSIDKCELLWNQLKADIQIALVDKKLKTSILEKDIHILIDNFLIKMRLS